MDPAEELRLRFRYLWIHRHGDKTPRAAISDVIDVCWKNEDLRPLIVKENKNTTSDKAWSYLIHIPPGIGYDDFKKREQLFADATAGSVHISKRGKEILMEVLTEQLGKEYPFSLFDPEPYTKMMLPFPVGYSSKGLIVVDLADFPHLFIAGETNYGKSNMLHVILNSVLLYRPDAWAIVIDPKETEFAYADDYAMIVSEPADIATVLHELNALMDRRKKILKAAKCVKIQKYNEKCNDKSNYMAPILVIVDELAELQNDESVQEDLCRLGRMGRFVGIHLVPATQRPSSKLWKTFGDFKALCHGRICFVVADEINSQMVIDGPRAAHLPAIRGRAIYKCGLECIEVQCLLLEPDDAEKLLSKRGGKNGAKIINPDKSSSVLRPRQISDLPGRAGQGRNNSAAALPKLLP